MAGITLDVGMFSIQYEEIGMVKILHTINPIVTIQAGCAKLVYMFGHKSLALRPLSMAGCTDLQIECINPVLMAGLAGHQAVVVILAVQRQAETGRCGVIEKLAIHTSRLPAIGRVAGGAVAVKGLLMNGRLGVATCTICGGLLEALGCQLAHCRDAAYYPLSSPMALHALHLSMLALQWKGCL